MPIDLETIAHIADLARLDPAHGLEEAEARAALEELTGDLAAVVGYIDVLAEAATEGVEPLYSLMLEAPGTRADQAAAINSSQEILGLAPDRIGNFFAVPKIL